MDTIKLIGLQYESRHGYYERERTEGNYFEVDLIFGLDLRSAAAADDLNQTVDYQAAERVVRNIMNGPSVKLIETLTHRIGEELFQGFQHIRHLEVSVRKLNPPLKTATDYSEVTMTWQR